MDLSLVDKEFDNTVGVHDNGQSKSEEVVEEFVIVKTVLEDEDDNNVENGYDDDDNNNWKKNDEQNDYYNNKEPVAEEEDDNEMPGDNNDEQVDDKTINEQDDDNKAEQEKWYYKAKFMLDWVNKFLGTHYVHPGFAISIDEMMKLFKGCLNMTHRMKKKPIKKGFKFYAMVCAWSGYCFFLS